jgi:TPR repeat protein
MECGALGNANCNYQIGIALMNLNGYEKTDSTIYFLKKAATAGHEEAMYRLGDINYNSNIRNLNEAKVWYQKAADKNNISAKLMLSQIKIGESNAPHWFKC